MTNPKHENRNPRQYQSTNDQNSKINRVLVFELGILDLFRA